jgi:hypothetical protein
MTNHAGAFEAAQGARWLRPDAYRWIRPDAAGFLKPGTDPREVYPALARKYSPDQPRVPAGNPDGGQWTDGGGIAVDTGQPDSDGLVKGILARASRLRLAASPADYRECVKLCYPLLERFASPGSDKNYWDFQKCLNACLKRGL